MPETTISPGLQQVQQMLKEAQKQIKPTGPAQQSFGQVLEAKNQVNQVQEVAQIQKMDLQKLQKTPTAIKSLFNAYNKDQNTMSKIMDLTLNGENLNPSQLLVLQQATYKVTFELEAMSKLVEQASSAVKTTMQTQV